MTLKMLKRITNNKKKMLSKQIPKSKPPMRGNHNKQRVPFLLFLYLMRKKIEFSVSLTVYFEKWLSSQHICTSSLKWKWCFIISSLKQNTFLSSCIKTFCHNHKTFFQRISSTTAHPSNDSGNDPIRHISTSGKSKVKTLR